MAEGDEPGGKNMEKYLGKLLTYWKGKDTRRVYTTAGGWPIIPENDFNLIYGCRIHEDNNGLRNIINDKPPQTLFDFRDFVSKFTVPTLSHETGQWCVYPDFKEIKKYTGALRARNYEIFRDFLTENNMGDQAEDFLMASGKLQALCYKADIEAALRTPGMAGTVLLELHDFQGEGTSPVGVLNVFFEPKGYITPEEYKRFFCETVPLARMQKLIYSNNESFKADIEVAHFGAKPLIKPVFLCRIINQEGEVLKKEIFTKDKIAIGNCFPVSSLSLNLEGISKAQKLKLEVSIENTPYKNSWDFWVYPAKQEIINGNVLITEKLDENAEAALKKGGSVLLLTFGKVGKEKGDKVSISFSPIFWNTAVFKEQKPQTLGILCNPKHPVFSKFPTDYHSDWQWWDPLTHAQVMILDDFPANIRPLIQPIDDWFEARRLALVFEAKTNGGKLMVCSIDLKNISEERLVSKQLMLSILNYMNSESFNPKIEVEMSKINGLITN
jgi:hypothetical protein